MGAEELAEAFANRIKCVITDHFNHVDICTSSHYRHAIIKFQSSKIIISFKPDDDDMNVIWIDNDFYGIALTIINYGAGKISKSILFFDLCDNDAFDKIDEAIFNHIRDNY